MTAISRFAKFVLIAGIAILIATLHPEISGDGIERYSNVESILNHTPVPAIKYSLIQPLLSVPIAVISKILGANPRSATAYFNLIIFLVIGLGVQKRLRAMFDEEISYLFWIILLSASMLPNHLSHYYGEIFSSFAILCGVLFLDRSRFIAPILIALGVANTPALAIPLYVAAILPSGYRKKLVCAGIITTAIVIAENMIKFGSVFGSPYLSANEKGFQTFMPYSGMAGFSYPVFFGVLSILLSFGKGLLFFVPGLVLLLRRSTYALLRMNHKVAITLAAAMIAMILVYSKWWAWYGGGCWGPRFFLLLVFPAALALSVCMANVKSRNELALLLVIISLSVWVGIDGVLFSETGMEICGADSFKLEVLCWYTPEFSALWRPFVIFNLSELMRHAMHNKRTLFAVWQSVAGLYLIVYASFKYREAQSQDKTGPV